MLTHRYKASQPTSDDIESQMSTWIIFGMYVILQAYRMREDKKWRRAHEVEDGLHRREVVELKNRLSAIEDALRSSPFVTFGRI